MIYPSVSHRVTVTKYEAKPWWVLWRGPRIVAEYEEDCYCGMAAFWNAATTDTED